jgi:serine/threonine protein kinase
MNSLLASVRREDGYDRVDNAVRSLEEQWRHGEPSLEQCWAAHDPDRAISVLAALIKADLRCRFARGERPAVGDYLKNYPLLEDAGERVLSLIYEEYCLREEQGEPPDVESFCARYAPWRDSLVSQLKYHQLLSRVVASPTPPARFPEPGEHFQEFAIDALLGQGGAARVYRARNDLLGGRQFALKVSPDRGHEPSIMGRLDHDHIVPVHSVVFQRETHLRGLIMPYRPGLPLDEVIRRVKLASPPLSASVFWDVVAASVETDLQTSDGLPGWNTFPMRGTYAQGVAWIMATLADAVAHAHERGVQHRDIKPANVLLTLHDGPQLLDFNLAHDPHAAEQAEAALRGGTLPYMAPEQLEAFIDPARWNAVGCGADLYSLGLVMHELLTGEAPAVPDQTLPLPRAIRSLLDRRADQNFNPRRLNPAVPHALEAITLRCLAYAETDRYAAAHELAQDLRRFERGKPLGYAVNPSRSERVGNWCRRNRAALAASVLLLVAGLVLAENRLTPVERRGTFREAMAAVDSGADGKALALLAPLSENYPDSPLVQLYYAAAQASTSHLPEAMALYKKATALPDAEAVLGGWAREYPSLIQQLETLGVRFDDVTLPNSKRPDPRYRELGHKILAMALRLGSTDEKVQVRDATYDEDHGLFDSALRKMTAVIDQIERIARKDVRDGLLNKYNCFRLRARNWNHLADQALGDDGAGSLETARSRYEHALTDLDRAQSLPQRDDFERIDACLESRAKSELGLGRIAVRQARFDDAVKHHREAHRLIELLRPRHSADLAFHRLEGRLAELEEQIEVPPGAALSVAR